MRPSKTKRIADYILLSSEDFSELTEAVSEYLESGQWQLHGKLVVTPMPFRQNSVVQKPSVVYSRELVKWV